MARPTDYSEELATEICERIAEGESLHRICQDEDKPDRRTVHRWLVAHKAFCHQYAHAKDLAAELRSDECLDIADEAQHADTSVAVQAAKLRIDTRQWYAKVTAPKKYGTEHVEATNKNLNTEVSPEQLADFNKILNGAC